MNLCRLHALFPERGFDKKAKQLLCSFGGDLLKHPAAFSKALQAIQFEAAGPKVIVLAGRKSDPALNEMKRTMQRVFVPGKVLVLNDEGSEASIIPAA